MHQNLLLEGHAGSVAALVVISDSKYIISGDGHPSGTVRIGICKLEPRKLF